LINFNSKFTVLKTGITDRNISRLFFFSSDLTMVSTCQVKCLFFVEWTLFLSLRRESGVAVFLTSFKRTCLFWLNFFLLANQSTNLDQWQIKSTSYLYNEVNSAYHRVKISSFDEFLVLKSARVVIM